jgi:hypothetical protein
MKTAVISVLLLALLPQTGIPQGVRVHNGFLKAEDFLHLSAERQRSYAAGVVDGMLLAPLFGAPDSGQKIRSFGVCIEGMSDIQVAAIIEKFLRDHPERWNDPLNAVVFSSMTEGCARK